MTFFFFRLKVRLEIQNFGMKGYAPGAQDTGMHFGA
jgi:hypothetical protein